VLITGCRGRRVGQNGRTTAGAGTVVAVRWYAAIIGRSSRRRGSGPGSGGRRRRSRRRQREQRGIVVELSSVDGGRGIRDVGGPTGDRFGDGPRRVLLRLARRRRPGGGVGQTRWRRRNGNRRVAVM